MTMTTTMRISIAFTTYLALAFTASVVDRVDAFTTTATATTTTTTPPLLSSSSLSSSNKKVAPTLTSSTSAVAMTAAATMDHWFSSLSDNVQTATTTSMSTSTMTGRGDGNGERSANRNNKQKKKKSSLSSSFEEDDALAMEAHFGRSSASRSTTNHIPQKYDSLKTYMKNVCNHELLNKNEEIILGREVQILMKWEEVRKALEDQLVRPPTYQEWATAVESDMTAHQLKRQIRRSLRAKAALMESNVRLVASIAKRYRNRGVSFQDLTQEGILGLTRACEKFDPERGYRFSTYASWWIRQSVLRAIVNEGRTIRLPSHVHDQLSSVRKLDRELRAELGREPTVDEIADRSKFTAEKIRFLRRVTQQLVSMEQELKTSKNKGSAAGMGGQRGGGVGGGGASGNLLRLADVLSDPETPQPLEQASRKMLRDDVNRLVMTLSNREQAVIRMRFGLDDGKAKTLEEIGQRFSVTRERIRQIEVSALRKLRQPYRNHAVRCYVEQE